LVNSDTMYGKNNIDTLIWRITILFIMALIFGIILVISDSLFHMGNLGYYTISFSILSIAIMFIRITIGVIIQKRF